VSFSNLQKKQGSPLRNELRSQQDNFRTWRSTKTCDSLTSPLGTGACVTAPRTSALQSSAKRPGFLFATGGKHISLDALYCIRKWLYLHFKQQKSFKSSQQK